MDKNTPDPPSLYDLSPSLQKAYVSLHGGAALLFRRLFIALWRYLWPVSRVSPVANSYVLPRLLKSLKPALTMSQWFMLCRLYIISGAGSLVVDSRQLKLSRFDLSCVYALEDHKLITRTRFDPLNPRLTSHRTTKPVFITFTPSGIAFYRGAINVINYAVMNDVMNYQPLSNKKGQP